MQLHTLTFQAIGPFDGVHTIDFSRLGASGLFLLEGPTGAGKSTIIDAIVFALYGGLAGDEASKQRLHSHHADAGVEPFVDLTFSTQAGSYRIRRSPAHDRPKRTGTGTTVQNETAKLSRLASLDAPDMGQEISTRAQEIGPEIKRLIGLDKRQFLQTVVLPQGEFAKFLRSTGEERKGLLQTIFRTDVYEEVTEQLKGMRIAAKGSIDRARIRVGEAFAGFRAAADFDDSLDDQDFGLVQSASVKAVGILSASAAEARQGSDAAQNVVTTARKHHDQQVRLRTLLAARAELLTRAKDLVSAVAQIDEIRVRLEAAQRATSVAIAISGLRKASQEFERSVTALDRAHEDYGHEAATLTKTDLVRQRDEISAEITELTRLLAIESNLSARLNSLATLRATIGATQTRIDALVEQVAAAPELVAEGESELKRLMVTAGSLDELKAKVERARKSVAALTSLETITARIAVESFKRDDLVARGTAANDAVRALRQRQLDDYAGVLSSNLVAGRPCAVCGSREHPAPAELQHDHPSVADIEAAERKLGELTAAAGLAAEQVNAQQQEFARKHEQAEGLDKDSATLLLDQAEQQLALGVAAQNDLIEAELVLVARKKKLADDQAQLTQTRIEVTGQEADLGNLDDAVMTDETQIEGALAGRAATLDQLLGTLRSRRELIDRLTGARDVHTAATGVLAGRRREVDETLTTHHFDTIEDAQAAVLDESVRASFTTQVKVHDLESTRVGDGLSQLDIVALTGEETTDVPAAVEALQASQGAARGAQTLADVLESRRKSAARALVELDGALALHETAVQESGAIVRLAGISEGSHPANTKKVSLGTYVLMRRFDDVVNAANVRYGPMSNGRYQLARIEENEGKGGGRRTGLALAIQDGETGTQREPRSLSGGETFVASLCLALGLADVVTGEAGGIELGTLFVDEGFGTLDAESLDLVMAALGKISKGGRTIGVVSHVDELKQRIADRIEVRHKRGGASTLRVRAEGEDRV
ncbi:MAG: SMC family ATPase [Kineosporiaceae bacterium]|nr:SMC family ATPase [Aeromicrobium sp.]